MSEELEQCYVAAMRILRYRFNSEAELRRKLARKRVFDAETIDATMERLRGEKWLDDQRFAGAFVRAKALKRVGKKRIARQLQAAGVEAGEVEQAIDENAGAEQQGE